jgi:PPOX class probable FMN-dependent enzyme
MTNDYDPATTIVDAAGLETHYGEPLARSLTKELDHLSDHYAEFIRVAPFAVLGTSGSKGLDTSPRGDAPGFVRVVDARTLMIPDRRGNNRVDTLNNLIEDPRISLLFLIPGVGETMRVSGTARIVTDTSLCADFSVQGKPASSVIVVSVEKVYYQCQKALVRSKLWEPASQVERSTLPSAGEMTEAMSDGEIDAAAYDRDYPERMKKTLY